MAEAIKGSDAVDGTSNGASEFSNPTFDAMECVETSQDADDGIDVIDEDIDEDDEDEKKADPFRDPPDGYVRLRPSAYNNIPATVFIEYPPELNIKRADVNFLEKLGKRQLCYTSYWERICIRNAFHRAGFEKDPKGPWTAMWSKHQTDDQMQGLNCLQKVNHFPHSWCVGRKDRLARTMHSMYRVHGAEFNFHPPSFILPAEREAANRQIAIDIKTATQRGSKGASIAGNGGLYIIKPVASSCGRGIHVISGNQVTALPKNKKALVQKYIADPYLIDGHKFDLRIYCLVTGVDPMRIYIFKEGLTRISTVAYSLKNIDNRFAHLTNYSVNKKSKEFKAATEMNGVAGQDLDCETEGFKWSLTAFKRWLAKQTSEDVVKTTMSRIDDLLIKTMIAAESTITPQLHAHANYRSNCFELFGADVLLDSKLTPHLIEVNISPSLTGSSPLDKRIKGTLIADIMHTVGTYPHDPKLLKKFDECGIAPPSAHSSKKKTSSKPSARPSSAGLSQPKAKRAETECINPFKFGSMTKMMASQDAWRKNPSPENISFEGLEDNDAVWIMLLMAEDEFSRCDTTQFVRKHPVAATAAHYNGLYFSSRFSDQLLARWVIDGGAKGSLGKYIPERFLSTEMLAQRKAKESEKQLRSALVRERLGQYRGEGTINRLASKDITRMTQGRVGVNNLEKGSVSQRQGNTATERYTSESSDDKLRLLEAIGTTDISATSQDYMFMHRDHVKDFDHVSESEFRAMEAYQERPKNPACLTPLTMAEAYDVVKNGLIKRGRGGIRKNTSAVDQDCVTEGTTKHASLPDKEPVTTRPQNPYQQKRRPTHMVAALQHAHAARSTNRTNTILDESNKLRSRSNPATQRSAMMATSMLEAGKHVVIREASSSGAIILPSPPASGKSNLTESQMHRTKII